jgi:hypothetical protein
MRWFALYEEAIASAIPEPSPELEALILRQAAAEEAEHSEFRKMQLHRVAYDTRPKVKDSVLDEIAEELEDSDDMMRRALGG